MKKKRLVASSVALLLGMGFPGATALLAAPRPPHSGVGVDHDDWAAPPREFQTLEREGYRDGVIGARRDFGNHRRPDVDNRWEFRHPNLPRNEWEAYRRGFRRGYQVAASHLWGAAVPAPPPMQMAPPPVQSAPPPVAGYSQYGDHDRDDMVRQRGFQEGMLGALRDLINNRRPDPDNRDEFRRPDVPYPMWDAYRDGFQRGYRITVEQLSGAEFRGMAHGPGGQVRQQGYQDGFSGAIKDFGNNRRPDPDNRDEFRHPNVPYQLLDAYRDGFRRGYGRATAMLQGRGWRH